MRTFALAFLALVIGIGSSTSFGSENRANIRNWAKKTERKEDKQEKKEMLVEKKEDKPQMAGAGFMALPPAGSKEKPKAEQVEKAAEVKAEEKAAK